MTGELMRERVTMMKTCVRRSGAARAAKMSVTLAFVLLISLLVVACFETEVGETYYGRVVVPQSQEFRWSSGGLPRVFDPARAAAPPDTDAVRALYEGLTDYEPRTLRPIPAVAREWQSDDGGRTWLFRLRDDARWSNGDAVTAADFVRSWRRTLRLGDTAPHARLLAQIAGTADDNAAASDAGSIDESNADVRPEAEGAGAASVAQRRAASERFGAVALDTRTLKVTLRRPDPNFPSLVAHPVFRPVHELSPELEFPIWAEDPFGGARRRDLGLVTNGAFRLMEVSGNGVVLERDKEYWDAGSVKLERVTFVNRGDAEGALAAYRAGEVDAVTNAAFEPLALKLLAPYEDFRRETFAALNYYRFNATRPPFDDRRVREAFALALNLDRIAVDVLGGSVESAQRFLPFGEMNIDKAAPSSSQAPTNESDDKVEAEEEGADRERIGAREIRQDTERAARLLAEAGYPGGEKFPRVRLLVNRSEQQRLVAQAVARMWREALGVETEIVVKPWEEYEMMLRAGDYDIARRSLVMQTLDEAANVAALFEEVRGEPQPATRTDAAQLQSPGANPEAAESAGAATSPASAASTLTTEAEALREMPAIPLYFASSYTLVKPYVIGFESNLLDAPSLKHVGINTGWTRPTPAPPAAVVNKHAR